MIRVCEVKTQTVGKMIVFRQLSMQVYAAITFSLLFFHSSQYNAIIGLRARQADGIPLWKLYRHFLSLKARSIGQQDRITHENERLGDRMKTGFYPEQAKSASLGKMFAEADFRLTGYYSRQREAAQEAAAFTGGTRIQ